MLSGETVATETALTWGLIDELVDDNAVFASALAKAERMASGIVATVLSTSFCMCCDCVRLVAGMRIACWRCS